LLNQIKNCFNNEFGPGYIPKIKKSNKKLIGVIVPHAGYLFSGAIASNSYKEIAENGFADVFIILGTNHRGIGSGVSLYPGDFWESPLGNIPVDKKIVENLAGGIIDLDEIAHSYPENSIEVQLPFLQFLDKETNFSIATIALSMQDFETSRELGEKIAKVINNEKRRVMIIASSDFSHEGFAYGKSTPDGLKPNQYAIKQDKLAINKILKMDPKGLIKTVYEKNISMCGYGPVAAFLYASKLLGARRVELLKYATSYDIYPDSSACVGYGAFGVY
jgi:AmmeMemoRadiSam system protein B